MLIALIFIAAINNFAAYTRIELVASERQSDRFFHYHNKPFFYFLNFVIPERIELSTPGLKDRCSNQLSYEIIFLSGKQDSNLRPPASKAGKQQPLSFQFSIHL